MTTLNNLKENQICKVKSVNVIGKLKYRLLDMGIVPKTKIKLTKKAPLGDPLQIEVRGYSLSIRKEIASKIEVEGILWY